MILRWLAGTALRWYYRDITVIGRERIPRTGPLLLATNHPNALVDALVAVSESPRRLTLTAKATLFRNPLAALLFRAVGMVPLRRAKDEPGQTDAGRNEESFRALLDVLAAGGAILIFPEGISHGAPSLAPLKTGTARLAMSARETRGVRGLTIVPFGLTFERKDQPRTRVVALVGEPLSVDAWTDTSAHALTDEIDRRLRAVTLNAERETDIARVLSVARMLAAAGIDDARPLDDADPALADELALAWRVDAVRRALPAADPAVAARVELFERRADALAATIASHRLAAGDLTVDPSVGSGAWFVVREASIAVAAGPLALWGRLNHWLPVTLARAAARRSSHGAEDPATATIVAGLALVSAAYAVQTAVVWTLAGPIWAALYLVTLPLSAAWGFRFGDRVSRGLARARTYLAYRRSPALRAALLADAAWLRDEAVSLETVVRPPH